jgi:hypothetical protein
MNSKLMQVLFYETFTGPRLLRFGLQIPLPIPPLLRVTGEPARGRLFVVRIMNASTIIECLKRPVPAPSQPLATATV